MTISAMMNIQAPPDEPWLTDVKASGCTSKISVSPISEYKP